MKDKQVSFRVDAAMYGKIEDAAAEEELSVADFCRKLFRWSFEQYEGEGNLHTLRRLSVGRQTEAERSAFDGIGKNKKRTIA